MKIPRLYLLLLLPAPCVVVAQQPSPQPMAQQVTIYRDNWGTPHVFGKTDASTMFGFAYAQAEDNFPQLEEDFVLALGRGAELYGPDLTKEDLLNRTLAIEDHAKGDYQSIDPHMRSLCDAFAAGVNFYLARHPAVHPRLLSKIEPWYPLAFIRYSYYQNGFARDPKLGEEPAQTAALTSYLTDNGSNGWVVSPSHSASGHALLFIDPHLPFYGPAQVYEGHIHSDEGWEFSGYARFGFPFPYIGHNANLGWMSTDNFADMVDGYVEHFDDPTHPLVYRYGSAHKTAIATTVSIRVKDGQGMVTREFQTLWTVHGPILTKDKSGLPIAVRLPMYESHGWIREWYDMTKARNLKELIATLTPHVMLFGNVMSADRDGHIFYVYNAAIPVRNPGFDWSKPVDGSDPATEWKGYYAFSDLPQLTDPKTGWMQNCNTSPFVLTTEGNPDPKHYPKYMVREGVFPGSEAQNPRGLASERILSTHAKFTFEEWARFAFDTHVSTADQLLPKWLPLVKASTPAGESPLQQAATLLEKWDRVSRVDSVPMTIFTRWHAAMRKRTETPDNLTAALQDVLADLSKTFGDWKIPYGEVNRLARTTYKGKPVFGPPAFDDGEPSMPVPAVNGNDGAVFTMYAVPGTQNRRRYGVAGDTYVSVVEFGPQPRALSVITYGESGDPQSPHFSDQASLFAAGQFKPSWFTLDEVKKNTESAYHPGD